MTLRTVNPEGVTIPGISQAMIVDGGRLIFLSGHVPMRADGSLVERNLEAQLVQVFENLQTTLLASGANFDKVARLTIYVLDYDPKQLAAIRNIRDRYINLEAPPASALVGVAALFQPDVLVEVDAIAVLPSDAG